MLACDARQADNWKYWSSLLCLTANANRDPKKKPSPYTPGDFDPFVLAKRKKAPKLKITMRQAFNLISRGSKL